MTTTEQKINSLKYFSQEAKEKVKEISDIFESDIFQQDLFKRLGNDAWSFHPDFEPGKERPPELTDKRMKHDFGQKHLLHLFQRLKPYNCRVLWVNGKTPDLLNQFLDEEIAGWKGIIASHRVEVKA